MIALFAFEHIFEEPSDEPSTAKRRRTKVEHETSVFLVRVSHHASSDVCVSLDRLPS